MTAAIGALVITSLGVLRGGAPHVTPRVASAVRPQLADRAFERRAALAALIALAPGAALGFDNGIPDMAKYKDKPKQRGPKPSDIGLKRRLINADGDELDSAVKTCSAAPNCFSTTGDANGLPEDAEHLIAPWVPPKGTSAKQGLTQLVEVLKTYPPGHDGIDGGGFKLVEVTPTYVYAQFESLRQGYIDDVEFAAGGGAAGEEGIQVRSSSRLGYLDFAVNAVRLNWIAAQLRQKGWAAAAITPEKAPSYFQQNAPRKPLA